MRGHNPNDVLKVHTPIIELLRKNPPPQDLLEAVRISIIEASVQITLVRASINAARLLFAVRNDMFALGRITFPVYHNLNSDYPSCSVVLAKDDTSAKLYCRVNLNTDEVHVSSFREDQTKPPLVVSLSHLRAERHATATLN